MMILDTNVISEPMNPGANPAVQNWLDRQYAETLFYPQGSALSRRAVNSSDNGGRGRQCRASQSCQYLRAESAADEVTQCRAPGAAS